jgi:hypothetical protein
MNGYTIIATRASSNFPSDGQVILGVRNTLYGEIEYLVARRLNGKSTSWYGGFYTLDFQRAIDNYTTR